MNPMTGPRSLVLVHSPLVGRLTWESVGVHLRHRGHFVVVPSLADVADEGPPYHRRFAEAVAEAVAKAGCDTPAVLVGHSGAGALLPEIAELLGPDAHAAVFVDALMPHQETSWFDTAPPELGRKLVRMTRRGLLPRWHRWFPRKAVVNLLPDRELRRRFVKELPRLPLAYFQEQAPAARAPARSGYVRLSAAYDGAADEAARLGWPVWRLDADHLAMLTRPRLVADAVAEAVAALE